MNCALRLLYRSGAWLHRTDAASVAYHGLLALRANRRCAEISVTLREPRFPLFTKLHMIHHTFRNLEVWAQKHEWVESPLCDSCQVDESFIGILARFSRRVSPKQTVGRTLDLYMTSLKRHWDAVRSEE